MDEKLSLHQQLTAALREEPEPQWAPQAGPQCAAYLSDADELFFGGSVGGGKSWLLLGLGLTAHVRSLLLRNELAQLEGFRNSLFTLQREGDEWRGASGGGGTFTTADGRTIELNGCDSFKRMDKKFRGRDHDAKLFDELPTFPENVYTSMVAWLRTPVPGQRTRVVGTGNPPTTPEQEWVLNYWSPWLRDEEVAPGELLYYAAVGDSVEGHRTVVRVDGPTPIKIPHEPEPIIPVTRTFIPSTLADNPIYEATGYRKVLQNIQDPKLRAQLEKGDMRVGLEDHPAQIIPASWIDAAMKRWRPREANDPRRLTVLGIDPARGGKDRFTIAKRYENWIDRIVELPGKRVPNGRVGAQAVLMEMDDPRAILIVDITGTAGGDLFGSMTAYSPHTAIYGFVASGRSEYHDATGRMKMRNKRTEAYWRLRDALNPNNPTPLALPPSMELRNELIQQRGYLFVDGMGLEDKDEIIKRIGRSPDLGDAVAMTMMDADATGGWVGGDTPTKLMQDFMGGQIPANPMQYKDDRDHGPQNNSSLEW